MYDLVLVVVSINNENMATETETLPNSYVEAQTWYIWGEWSEK